MSGSSFRFLHAADFGLERPIRGLEEVPDHLRDRLIDAPYEAARRVFETAVLEEVDFLALAGNLLDPPAAGPAAIAFLLEQFRLMREHGIAVYWAAGRADWATRWPASVKLPEGVHVFPADYVEAVTHVRDEQGVAVLLGRSGDGGDPVVAADFSGLGNGRFTVAITSGRADSRALRRRDVNYWALGGRTQRRTLDASPSTALYPGSPQGRCVDEAGACGCILADVDEEGRTRVQSVATDAVRWRRERIVLADDATRDDLELLLVDRAEQLTAEREDRCQLVVWTVEGGGRVAADLRNRGLGVELAGELRRQFGRSDAPLWTVAIKPTPPEAWPLSQQEEQTILGDFLRAVAQRQAEGEPLDLTARLPASSWSRSLDRAARVQSAEARARVLRKAAALGADLLGGPASREEGRSAR